MKETNKKVDHNVENEDAWNAIYCNRCGDKLEIVYEKVDHHGKYFVINPCINGCKHETREQAWKCRNGEII